MLSPRERDVYHRRQSGERNKSIAESLGISEANVAVTLKNARTRIASGIPARGFDGRQETSDAQLARHRKRMSELARGRKCPRCQLRGEHECLPSRAREIAGDRSGPAPSVSFPRYTGNSGSD
jgi:hypothetical protein